MSTQPEHTFTVVVHAHIDDGDGRTRVRTVPIPPEYGPADQEQLFGFVVEGTAGALLTAAGWRRPRFRALLINAARLWLIEQLITGDDGELAEKVRDIILRDDEAVLAEADLPPED